MDNDLLNQAHSHRHESELKPKLESELGPEHEPEPEHLPGHSGLKRRDFLKSGLRVGAAAVAFPAVSGGFLPGTLQRTSLATPATAALARGGDATAASFLEACRSGDIETVRRFLTADASVLASRDDENRSGFALALLNGHRSVGDLLTEAGYRSDLHESALALDWERMDLLAEECRPCVDKDHPIGGTTMYAAAAGGAGRDIWHVYAATASPNANPRGVPGATALQVALEYRDLATAELQAAALLSNNADPNPPPNRLQPPLHIAARRGSSELVEMLIRFRADVGARDADGLTAAESARRAGAKLTTEVLEAAAAIPPVSWSSRRAKDAAGGVYSVPTELHRIDALTQQQFVGAAHRDLDALRDMISAHPSLAHAVATTGEHCVEAGAHMGNHDIVEFLLERGAPYALPTAVMRNDLECVRAELDEDPARINERGAHAFALLWYPIIGGAHVDMIQLLLDCGAKIEDQHFLGTTALHYACLGGDADIVVLLIENGANVNRPGRKFSAEPMTPMQAAERRGHTAIVDLLRANGAVR